MKFLQVFESFFDYLNKNLPQSYQVIIGLNKLLIQFFTEKNEEELMSLICENFKLVAAVLNREDLGRNILRPILSFSTEDYEEEERVLSRCLAANLFCDLAGVFGQEYCEHYIIPQLFFLSDDPKANVRKAVIQNLSKVSEQVSFSFFGKVLTIYQK